MCKCSSDYKRNPIGHHPSGLVGRKLIALRLGDPQLLIELLKRLQ